MCSCLAAVQMLHILVYLAFLLIRFFFLLYFVLSLVRVYFSLKIVLAVGVVCFVFCSL